MSLDVRLSSCGNILHMRIGETFDFAESRHFHESYRKVVKPGLTYRIDFSRTAKIGTAALGMLLMLKEFAHSHRCSVVLSGLNEEIQQMAKIARLNQLFVIEGMS